jgi:hypothetical protein
VRRRKKFLLYYIIPSYSITITTPSDIKTRHIEPLGLSLLFPSLPRSWFLPGFARHRPKTGTHATSVIGVASTAGTTTGADQAAKRLLNAMHMQCMVCICMGKKQKERVLANKKRGGSSGGVHFPFGISPEEMISQATHTHTFPASTPKTPFWFFFQGRGKYCVFCQDLEVALITKESLRMIR